MTIEKLARALYEPPVIDENPCDVTQWDRLPEEAREVWRSCARSILPLIAAELAGVARGMHYSAKNPTTFNEGYNEAVQNVALAIEAHARKMGEA